MVKSGVSCGYGAMCFWGPNGHDGVWHIAVINQLAKGSLDMPVFAGERITNYHIGFDLIVAVIHRLTALSITHLYFQILPPVFAILVGALVYQFIKDWMDSKQQAFWAVFFTYFSGSFGWLVTWLRGGGFNNESMFWSQQALSTLINPPYALSLVFLLGGLILMNRYIQSSKLMHLILASLVFGILIQIKVYAGLLVLGGLSIAGMFKLVTNKDWSILKVWALSFCISLVIFFPLNKGASGLFEFKPGWFLETMMHYPDRLGWEQYYSAMTNYRLGGDWVKGIVAYVGAFGIFLIGNMGIRIVSIYNLPYVPQGKQFTIYKIKKIDWIQMFIWSVVGAGIFIPMLFLQKGTPWNTIQFFYYSLFFLSILAGCTLATFLEKRSKLAKTVLVGFLITLTIPSLIVTLRHYVPSRPPAAISVQEKEALEFLRNQPEGVVLTSLYRGGAAQEAPVDLIDYASTAYVSAFSNKVTFLEDEVNLDITDFEWEHRRSQVEEFVQAKSPESAKKFLHDHKIGYIYWRQFAPFNFPDASLGLNKIYENQEVAIYLVSN